MQDFKKNTYEILKSISSYQGDELTYLIALVNIVRASKDQLSKGINEDFDDLIYWIETYPEIKDGLRNYILRLCDKKNISSILTDADMVAGIDFWGELWDRIILKFLPEKPNHESIESILSEAFYKESDSKWINDLDDDKCVRIMELLGFRGINEQDSQSFIVQELLFSLNVISHRISGYALDSKVMKMVPGNAGHHPFIGFQNEVNTFVKDMHDGRTEPFVSEVIYRQLMITIQQCNDYINEAYANIPEWGISFKAHQQLILIEKLLERFIFILGIISMEKTVSSKQKLVRLIKSLIAFTSGKSKISEYLNKSTQVYAREITRNIAIKGEEYITSGAKGYWKMFRSALGGGAIVAIACVTKLNLSGVEVSLFGKALLYSLNYSIAFVSIYLLHFTLATKQPAMTAATLAQNLKDDLVNGHDFSRLAELVSRIFRSQFIAFTGNVLMAFPVALIIMLGRSYFFDFNMPEYKAFSLIHDLNILQSPAIFHAAIAGVFLFLSGLIAGNIANRNKNRQIPVRIREHPVLKQLMSYRWRDKIAVFIDHYWPGIVSNFWFGIFMGSISTLGIIFGLDLDIRHITFAAGNFALALHGQSYQMTGYDIFHSILGIGMIGFVNFSVSFFLSLMLAIKSRGISWRIFNGIFTAIKALFKKRPFAFFFPLKVK